jgi:hypothetical protein
MAGIEERVFNNAGRLFFSLMKLGEARSSQWRRAAGVSSSSFHAARKYLLHLGIVEVCDKVAADDSRERVYRVSPHARREATSLINDLLRKVA